eukprot:scaffold3064_cov63-Phaeocystis_antarctica.AAC.6
MALSKLSADEQGIVLGQLVEPARAAPRRVLQQRQPRAAAASDAGVAAAAEGCSRGCRSAVPQHGGAELQGAARGEGDRLELQGPLRGRPDNAGHAGLGAASAQGPDPQQKLSRPRRRAAAGGGAGRGRATGCELP